MEPAVHYLAHHHECVVARAMAGVELGVGIVFRQSCGKCGKVVICLLSVEQMEAANHRMYGPGAGGEDILKSVVGTAGEKQPVGIECQLMAEIIRQQIAVVTLNMEKAVPYRQRMNVGNPGNHPDAIA